jgi:plastocyanin
MNRRNVVIGAVAAAIFALFASPLKAQEVSLSVTIKNHAFQPGELRAPAGKPIRITVHNADATAAEFESSDFRVEKVIPAGGTGTVSVRPLTPGRYRFFDDFHQETQGYLVVQ